MAKLYGDPARVGEEAARAELEKALRELEEAYKAGQAMLDDKRKQLLRTAVERAVEAYLQALERLRSEESKRELQLRTRVAEEKNKYLDEVMKRAMERIKAEKAGTEWYERYMRRVMEAAAAEAAEHGGFVVRVAAEDLELAKRIAEGLEGIEVSSEPVDILGGIIARSRDGSVTLDYTLDFLIREAESRLRSIASKILFG
jgi:V/A-type H+-transporting ATPase subunit E